MTLQLCNLTTTNPSVTIHDKNDHTFTKTDDKSGADESLKIGETVNYTITGKVPDTTGFKDENGNPYYLYQVTDTMTAGLTLSKTEDGIPALTIKVDGDELNKENYTLKNLDNSEVDGFVLTIDVTKLQSKVGKEISVTYSAVINEKALKGFQQNKAELEYSSDPTDLEKKGKVQPDPEKVYNSQIMIYKFEYKGKTGEGETAVYDKSAPLAGAEFVLTKEGKYYQYVEGTPASGDKPAVPAKVEWVDKLEQATVKTTSEGGDGKPEKGTVSFDGLANGTYQLHEIKAPEGYNLMEEPLTIKIEDSRESTTFVHDAEVPNNHGSLLPGTGGIGTTIFYATGIILMAGAVFFVIRRKRA